MNCVNTNSILTIKTCSFSQALGNLYFIHQSIQDIQQWDFDGIVILIYLFFSLLIDIGNIYNYCFIYVCHIFSPFCEL